MARISFDQILTMVLLMAFGVFLYKRRIIDDAANKRISELVLFVINPIVIFMSYIRPFEPEMLSGLFYAVLLSCLSYALALAAAHLIYRKKGGEDFAVEKLAAVYSNCGFFGIPLIRGVFGEDGVFYLAAYLTVFNLLMWTHGVFVMSGDKHAAQLKKAVLSPAVIAVLAGFIFFIAGMPLHEVIERPMRMLGDMNTPMAMIVCGCSIANAKPAKIFMDARIYKLCLVRLVVIPALFVAARFLLNVPEVISGVVLIASACPAAATVVLFSIRYNRDYVYASELFAATTVLSIATIPLLLFAAL